MPKAERRTSRSLHDFAVDELGRRIVEGHYPAGSTLPIEPELGAELAISRSVLREALRVLASKGMVRTRPRVGTVVLDPGGWAELDPDVLYWRSSVENDGRYVEQLGELRAILEPAIARLAAERASTAELDAIGGAFDRLVASRGGPDWIEADLAYHLSISAGAGNAFLSSILSSIGSALRTGREVSEESPTAQSDAVIDLHRGLYDALRAHDPDLAASRATDLIDAARRDTDRAQR